MHIPRSGTSGKNIVRRNRFIGYCFLLPNLIGFILFTLIPVLAALVLSFLKWDSSNPAKFVGFDNFTQMFKDSGFTISFVNTIYFMGASVPLTVLASLVLAIILNKGIKGRSALRAIHFFPEIASMIAVVAVWQFLYNPDMGPINATLRALGIGEPPRWTSSVVWAMPAVIILKVWKSAGYYMVIFLAGLQGIPNHLYEAATIDGANAWQKFKSVTLPMLSPTMFFVLIINIIQSFKVFDPIYMMTDGGPGRATSVLVYYIYTQGFINMNFGYASAMALLLLILILLVTVIQFQSQKKWVNYTS